MIFATKPRWGTTAAGFAVLALSMALTRGAVSASEDFSGFWILDVARSTWGQMQKPISVSIQIAQHENEFRYGGSVLYANEDTRDFSFEGIIDGRAYPVTRSYGPGKLVLRRDGSVLESVYTSDNGLYVETARTVLSGDRRVMTRYLRLKCPDGIRSWVEVYRRS